MWPFRTKKTKIDSVIKKTKANGRTDSVSSEILESINRRKIAVAQRERCGDVCGVCKHFEPCCCSPVVGYCLVVIHEDPKRMLGGNTGRDFYDSCDNFEWKWNYSFRK